MINSKHFPSLLDPDWRGKQGPITPTSLMKAPDMSKSSRKIVDRIAARIAYVCDKWHRVPPHSSNRFPLHYSAREQELARAAAMSSMTQYDNLRSLDSVISLLQRKLDDQGEVGTVLISKGGVPIVSRRFQMGKDYMDEDAVEGQGGTASGNDGVPACADTRERFPACPVTSSDVAWDHEKRLPVPVNVPLSLVYHDQT